MKFAKFLRTPILRTSANDCFYNKRFREVLINQLSKITINKNDEGFETYFGVCWEVSDRFATRKQKYSRGKKTAFMNK